MKTGTSFASSTVNQSNFGEGCREPIPDAFNYYPADVTVDGTSLGEVGVRTRGLSALLIRPGRP